jgi:hypothetical protein
MKSLNGKLVPNQTYKIELEIIHIFIRKKCGELNLSMMSLKRDIPML